MARDARTWATYKLKPGDLTALVSIASRRVRADEARLARLRRRGFVTERSDGSVAVTIRGRLAIAIKRSMLW